MLSVRRLEGPFLRSRRATREPLAWFGIVAACKSYSGLADAKDGRESRRPCSMSCSFGSRNDNSNHRQLKVISGTTRMGNDDDDGDDAMVIISQSDTPFGPAVSQCRQSRARGRGSAMVSHRVLSGVS